MSRHKLLGLLLAGTGVVSVSPAKAQGVASGETTSPSAPTSPTGAATDVPTLATPAPEVGAQLPEGSLHGESGGAEGGASASTSEAPPAAEVAAEPELGASDVAPEATVQAEADGASAEEAAALALLMGGGDTAEAVTEEYNLGFYGFADFSVQRFLFDSVDGYPSSFSVGRLNLYFGGELGDNWRTLSEVRFSYLPNGTPAPGSAPFSSAPLTSTLVADYVDYDRPRRYGSILIERVIIEKTFDTWLNLQVGHFLTPYGIWNVDHGSPVILGVTRPYAVGENLFPESQTGFMLHGSYPLGAANLGYVLTLSNGRGPFDTTKDLDENKALGWRLRGNYDTDAGLFSLGYSGYLGEYTDGYPVTTFTPEGGIESSMQKNVNYDELGTAFDFKWELGGASVQSELIMQEVRQKSPQVRYQQASPFAPAGLLPDYRRIGVYGIAAYRIDSLLGLTPWVGTEYYDTGRAPGSYFADGVYELYLGLNLRPTPRVVLKTQYVGVFMKDVDRVDIINGQIAWSF